MAKPQSITTLPASPVDERRVRMIKYSVAMALRFVCIIAMLFVQGWWLVLCVAGAILLPYFAVVIANVTVAPKRTTVEAPSSIVRVERTRG
jgi:predicted tellurium resistance membrane protein TerC